MSKCLYPFVSPGVLTRKIRIGSAFDPKKLLMVVIGPNAAHK
jgi:hypothetical protein